MKCFIACDGLLTFKGKNADACRLSVVCGCTNRAIGVVEAVSMMMKCLYKSGQDKKEQEGGS
jgi:L-cysteine desulfidase